MTDTLFGEDPEDMVARKGSMRKGKRKVIRDAQWRELWEAAEIKFHRSGVPNNQRARVAKLVDDLRQMNATPATLRERISQYGRAFAGAVCTLPAIVKNWDACGPPRRTVQPGGSGEAERELYERITRQARAREQEQHEVDQARVIVLGAPVGVAEAMLTRWRADPDNANCVRFGRCDSPTDLLCVRWIAAEIEAMGV